MVPYPPACITSREEQSLHFERRQLQLAARLRNTAALKGAARGAMRNPAKASAPSFQIQQPDVIISDANSKAIAGVTSRFHSYHRGSRTTGSKRVLFVAKALHRIQLRGAAGWDCAKN